MSMKSTSLALAFLLSAAYCAQGQPTITSLGSGVPLGVTNNAGGTIYISGAGVSTTAAARWTLNGSTLTATEIGGSGGGMMSADGQYVAGVFANTSPQVFGYTASGVSPPFSLNPTLVESATLPNATESYARRWNAATNTLQILGGPNGLSGSLAQNVGLPVAPS